jgi:hypothetical protein
VRKEENESFWQGTSPESIVLRSSCAEEVRMSRRAEKVILIEVRVKGKHLEIISLQEKGCEIGEDVPPHAGKIDVGFVEKENTASMRLLRPEDLFIGREKEAVEAHALCIYITKNKLQ